MLSFPLWLLALALNLAHAAPGSEDGGLRAVKASGKTSKTGKRRTLQEWRAEQMRARAEEANTRKLQPETAPEITAPPALVEPESTAEDEASQQTEPSKAKRAKARKRKGEPQQTWVERYLRELEGLLALLTLWLITRIYGQTSAKNARKPPPRPSPVSAEELGRILFGIGRSDDVDSYRALFLNGAEAMQTLGPDQAEHYLSGRNLGALEAAYIQLSAQLPSGASYIKTELTPTHQCVIHVANPDGSGRTITIGTVAKIGAILRLVAPVTNPSQG